MGFLRFLGMNYDFWVLLQSEKKSRKPRENLSSGLHGLGHFIRLRPSIFGLWSSIRSKHDSGMALESDLIMLYVYWDENVPAQPTITRWTWHRVCPKINKSLNRRDISFMMALHVLVSRFSHKCHEIYVLKLHFGSSHESCIHALRNERHSAHPTIN